jgi:hypothetical protein
VSGRSTIRPVIGSLRTVSMIAMRGGRDGGGSAGPAAPGPRTAGLVAGSCLAVGATVGVLLTEDPQLLRLAVVAAAWAFVLAALAASRRSAGGAPADGGERAAVERADLERAAAEQSMRAELEALRGELAQVSELRRELGQVAELRREVAEVAGLRHDLAGLAELRTALAGVDLTALAELRTDVGRLRRELTEQLSGEMLVERVMLRTQSTRSVPAVEPPAARALLDPAPLFPAEPEPRRGRTDEPSATTPPVPDELLTVQRPVAQRERPPVPGPAAVAPAAEVPTPPSGGRRRRRYREDGEPDDVLSRVLGGS